MDNLSKETQDRKKTKLQISLSKYKRQFLSKHLYLARGMFFGLILLFALGFLSILHTFWSGSSVSYYIGLAQSFIFPGKEINLTSDRYNLLILGKGGEGHDAPELTDTILVMSLKTSDPRSITLISIPRDIWVPEFRDKINAAYKKGNEKALGDGFVLAKSSVEDIVGIPLSGVVTIDFSGFRELIDFVGGVDVNVVRTFTDDHYPIAGLENDTCGDTDPDYSCRYESITFTQGLTHMDGETALKFSRSRHSTDLAEGTDLARAARQQQVISALKDKLTSRDILSHPSKLIALWNILLKHTDKDMSDQALVALGRLAYESRESVKSAVLPEDLLDNPPLMPEFDNLYVYLPKKGDWSEVHVWAVGVLGL